MKFSKFEDEINISYHFVKAKVQNDNLVIVFPSTRLKGMKPWAEYIQTLASYNSNKLFLVDDIHPDISLSPYVTIMGDDIIERTFMKLVNKIIDENQIKHICVAGASGGGTAALYYGIKYNFDIVAASACSFMGEWLKLNGEQERADYLSGRTREEACQFLDRMTFSVIEENAAKYTGRGVIFYGVGEELYTTQGIKLKNFLEENNSSCKIEPVNFVRHASCVKYLANNLVDYLDFFLYEKPVKFSDKSYNIKDIELVYEEMFSNLTDSDLTISSNYNFDIPHLIRYTGDSKLCKKVFERAKQGKFYVSDKLEYDATTFDSLFTEIPKAMLFEEYVDKLYTFEFVSRLTWYCRDTNNTEGLKIAYEFLKAYINNKSVFIDNICALIEGFDYSINKSAEVRLTSIIEFLVAAHKFNFSIDSAVMEDFAKEIKLLTKKAINRCEYSLWIGRLSDFSLLTAAAFFKSNKELSDRISKGVIERLIYQIEVLFDKAGKLRCQTEFSEGFLYDGYYMLIKNFFEHNFARNDYFDRFIRIISKISIEGENPVSAVDASDKQINFEKLRPIAEKIKNSVNLGGNRFGIIYGLGTGDIYQCASIVSSFQNETDNIGVVLVRNERDMGVVRLFKDVEGYPIGAELLYPLYDFEQSIPVTNCDMRRKYLSFLETYNIIYMSYALNIYNLPDEILFADKMRKKIGLPPDKCAKEKLGKPENLPKIDSERYIRDYGIIPGNTFILFPEANGQGTPSADAWNLMKESLEFLGYRVLFNVFEKYEREIYFGDKICVPHNELIQFVELCGNVISVRSGGADIFSTANAKMYIISAPQYRHYTISEMWVNDNSDGHVKEYIWSDFERVPFFDLLQKIVSDASHKIQRQYLDYISYLENENRRIKTLCEEIVRKAGTDNKQFMEKVNVKVFDYTAENMYRISKSAPFCNCSYSVETEKDILTVKVDFSVEISDLELDIELFKAGDQNSNETLVDEKWNYQIKTAVFKVDQPANFFLKFTLTDKNTRQRIQFESPTIIFTEI